ncbi:MAG: TatD family hydrolase, partial [Candidatus Berkelbacteria bacterium]|nr:TatD family hydrolase [Candidatus Berkelbacteria bacterium]
YDNLYAIVGVHPHHADKPLDGCHPELVSGSPEGWIKQLERLAKHKKVVAIGEIGMDYFRYQSNGITDPKTQKEIFEAQIELAHKLKLPLQIHNRQAGKDILEILLHHKNELMNPPGMFHCFSGSINFLKKVLDLGFYVGFDGNITYKGLAPGEDTALSDLVKAAPLERILVETDSPFLTPQPHRKERNVPKYVIITGKEIARLKGISFDAVREKTTQNASAIFQL